MKFIRFLLHLAATLFLTFLTQIGGILYVFTLLYFRGKGRKKYLYFFGIYLIFTLIVVPLIAPLFGREKIRNSEWIEAHSVFYILANRNYVVPEMNELLASVSIELSESYPGMRLVYLDANFPFVDGFPLLPHLSHDNGKKLDISLIYQTPDGEVVNTKPSFSGYGFFEPPKPSEYNQIKVCKARGNWQYDYQKYLTFGTFHDDLTLSEKETKFLLQSILKQPQLRKVFIEPHLKHRFGLAHPKIRFHGCQAVRHDDHIHLQVK
ncbi:MAG: hypothetical protein AAFP76_02810 [Bacteroidota bacterium]